MRVSVGECGYPGDSAIPLGDGAPLAAGLPWLWSCRARRLPPARRAGRLLRRAAQVCGALFVVAAIALCGFLLIVPSVTDAPRLAQAIDQQHHVAYPGPAVPPRFAAALVATEDHRFYSEPGVDPIAIARVALAKVTGSGDQGGAMLYQQLARLLYTPGSSGVAAQAEQLGLAIKLDFAYSKRQVLQMYSDVAYFGHGYYGLTAASCGYFGVRPYRLSWPQAAMLAGVLQSPSADDPLSHPTNARVREKHVLGRLVAIRSLNAAQARSELAAPLSLVVADTGRRCAAKPREPL